jgi:AmmeMemoRadiSam system protein B
MSGSPLPALRAGLDLTPSPVPEHPGLLIRDPLGYSQATLIIPPPLVACLTCFDGQHSELDLRQRLFEITGDVRVGHLVRHLLDSLGEAGFLENEVAARLREEREKGFRKSPARLPAHAGTAYPDEPAALSEMLASCLAQADDERTCDAEALCGIAAPHVSLEGGSACYAAAYGALGSRYGDRTFVILGTSHYGQPDVFGLTRKPYRTPLGETRIDVALVDELAAVGRVEDYCHAVEHSIEFQVIFLQHLFGPQVRIAPVLCGPFSAARAGERPEIADGPRAFLEVLARLAADGRQRLFWVLGVDLSHVGLRYGDCSVAHAWRGVMQHVAARDRERLERVAAVDVPGFWASVQRDDELLKWCGSSPLYSFLSAVRPSGGRLLRYDQWDIDSQSAVSFAALAFQD